MKKEDGDEGVDGVDDDRENEEQENDEEESKKHRVRIVGEWRRGKIGLAFLFFHPVIRLRRYVI